MNCNEVVVIIPVFNPETVLLNLARELIDNNFNKIVIVNDGSTKNTQFFGELERNQKIDVLTHSVNLGKGRAIKTAFNHILNEYGKYKAVVTIDGDGQHVIADIRKCVEGFNESDDEKAVIFGCRNFENKDEIPLRSRFGNICTKYVLRIFCGVKISDSQTGLRVIPLCLLQDLLKVEGEGYEYETNMILKIADKNRLIEVPIKTIYENNNSASHFNPVKDSVRIYRVILKYSLGSFMSAMLDTFVFICLGFWFDNIYMMVFISRMISSAFNFAFNKKVVFKEEGNILKQGSGYLCLLFFSGSIAASFISICSKILHLNIVFLKIVIETVLYFVNFYIQKNYIFKNRNRTVR